MRPHSHAAAQSIGLILMLTALLPLVVRAAAFNLHPRNHTHLTGHQRHRSSLGLVHEKTAERLSSHATTASVAHHHHRHGQVATVNLGTSGTIASAAAVAVSQANHSGSTSTSFAAASAMTSITTSNDTSKPLKLMLANPYDASIHHRWTTGSALNTWNWNPRSGDSDTKYAPVYRQQPPGVVRDRAHHHTKSAGRHICTVHEPVPENKIDFHFNNSPRDFWRSSNDIGFTSNEVHRPKVTTQVVHRCCPGWAQVARNSNGCNKPICQKPCANGGKCIKPDVCSCAPGFSGAQCETDRNECVENKPCDQQCINTFGSYYCKCRDGFVLHSDKESCKRVPDGRSLAAGGMDPAFEARDMENDVDTDYSVKIANIEHKLNEEKNRNFELNKKVQDTEVTLQTLKQRLESFESRQQEILYIRDKLSAQEEQTRKLEHIVHQLYKCRSRNSLFCTLQ